MDEDALAICAEMMGCRFAYGQCDEYSFLATDFETYQSEPWFAGNIQKSASVSASIFTAAFNSARFKQQNNQGKETNWAHVKRLVSATFDSRVFVIPSRTEVENYFIWRQQDAARNSLNMLVSCHYSHKELLNASNSDRHELLRKVGVNWNEYPTDQKRGRVLLRRESARSRTFTRKQRNLAPKMLSRPFGNLTARFRFSPRIGHT
jgi:tRNA(His) 5'-end guanylyltransferase